MRLKKLDVSIFIPVYKDSDNLASILTEIIKQDVKKEIFVVIDEATESMKKKADEFSDHVKFIFNEERLGKANALNNAFPLSTGKVLLFLDADVDIEDDPDFLKKIIMEIQKVDVLDIKKQVIKTKSFLSKMAYYEYFSFNLASWLASKFMKKCPAVNGAAFAIKREAFEKIGGFHPVVAEDADIATRAFMEDCSFAYTSEVAVKNVVFSDWKKWFKQRNRWAIGQALWIKEWYRALIKKFYKKPQVFMPSFFFLYPSFAVFLLSVAVPSNWVFNSFLILILSVSVTFNIALPVVLFTLATADLLKTIVFMFLGFASTSVVYYFFSKKFGYKIKIHELFVYYFFYSTIWIAVIAFGYLQVFFGRKSASGWKT